MATAHEIKTTIIQALADDDYHYGLRVSDSPLSVGEIAPASRQWYADFISEDHPTCGREAFPDHDTDLAGTCAIGITSAEDIDPALRAAGVTPMDWLNRGRYGGLYTGRYVSLLRSGHRTIGNDPGEWIMPDAEVLFTWDTIAA